MKNVLKTEFAGLIMENPILLASGILGVATGSMIRLSNAGIGGVTTKTIGPRPREGYSNPSIIEIGEDTFLNSVGLANPGIDIFIDEIRDFKSKSSKPIIVSVFGDGPEGYAQVAKKAEKAGADAIEINVSCPHAEVASIALSEALTGKFTSEVKNAVDLPVFVKLTPNIANIVPIAQAAEKAGADAIVAINTVRGLAIDFNNGYPILSHGIGGISGKAIKPIGVRCIYEIYNSISIPLIGCGGIFSWKDVLEYIYAGATAVQIGSAFYLGESIISDIINGLTQFLENNQISSLQSIIGKSHNYLNKLQEKPKECP